MRRRCSLALWSRCRWLPAGGPRRGWPPAARGAAPRCRPRLPAAVPAPRRPPPPPPSPAVATAAPRRLQRKRRPQSRRSALRRWRPRAASGAQRPGAASAPGAVAPGAAGAARLRSCPQLEAAVRTATGDEVTGTAVAASSGTAGGESSPPAGAPHARGRFPRRRRAQRPQRARRWADSWRGGSSHEKQLHPCACAPHLAAAAGGGTAPGGRWAQPGAKGSGSCCCSCCWRWRWRCSRGRRRGCCRPRRQDVAAGVWQSRRPWCPHCMPKFHCQPKNPSSLWARCWCLRSHPWSSNTSRPKPLGANAQALAVSGSARTPARRSCAPDGWRDRSCSALTLH